MDRLSVIETALIDVLQLKERINDDSLPMDKLDAFLLSRMYSQGQLHPGWNHRSRGQRVITDGKAFAQAILPFSACWYEAKNSAFEYVDPFHVVAGAYYGVPKLSSVEGDEVADVMDARAKKDESEGAHYVRIGEFSLYVASEGKNRVSLYRELNRKIGARVFNSTYPPSHHLQLVRTLPFGGVALRYIGNQQGIANCLQSWQALSMDLAAIPFLESVRLLETYGVKWGRSQWLIGSPFIDRKVKLYVCRRKYVR
ncbi:hypothetical protein JX580_04190 [Thiomicrospira microaerophila]|uniref:hypothetical protein n=1 Tax=Thiomicrospira microaerophila TaxID=406020 RepID=UPI0020107523|nr:hypothetical protein [Thiomicrospira microaerophila]UQB43088.1 hypothetical protein JX580_04190 [Thiomicrospira microaerophila]